MKFMSFTIVMISSTVVLVNSRADLSMSLCSSSTTPSSSAVSIISASSSSVIEGSASFFENTREAKLDMMLKKAAMGLSSFIRNLSDPSKKSETVSLLSFAKLFGIISLNRNMITVLITEQIIENAKDSR